MYALYLDGAGIKWRITNIQTHLLPELALMIRSVEARRVRSAAFIEIYTDAGVLDWGNLCGLTFCPKQSRPSWNLQADPPWTDCGRYPEYGGGCITAEISGAARLGMTVS